MAKDEVKAEKKAEKIDITHPADQLPSARMVRGGVGLGALVDAALEKDDEDEPESDKRRDSGETVEVELEVSRQRAIGWTVFGTILGILLILNLGTVGVWAGFAVVAWSIFHAVFLIRSLVFPPGTIVVADREVKLPRGLCKPSPVVVKPSEVTAVYLLRRSVPWNKSSPVLVVELGQRAMVFPRDWFASEADQRHIVHALLRHREPVAESA